MSHNFIVSSHWSKLWNSIPWNIYRLFCIIWIYFTIPLLLETKLYCKSLKIKGMGMLRINSETTTVIRLSVIVRYVSIYTHMYSCPQDLQGFMEILNPCSFQFLRNLFYVVALYLPWALVWVFREVDQNLQFCGLPPFTSLLPTGTLPFFSWKACFIK